MTSTQVIANLGRSGATDGEWQAWVTGISTGLQAVATVASDTGQINPATTTKPTAKNTVAGFEMYRFDDALQATAPVFIKVEYGTTPGYGTSSNSYGWCIYVTVGSGTNGSGTLTGQVSRRCEIGIENDGTSRGNGTCYFSGDDNRLCMVLNADIASVDGVGGRFPGLFLVERSHDSAGDDTGDFIYFSVITDPMGNSSSQPSNSGPYSCIVPFSGTVDTFETPLTDFNSQSGFNDRAVGAPLAVSSAATTLAIGNETTLAPYHPYGRGRIYNPAIGAAAYINSNITALTPITVEIYGANRTYFPFGAITSHRFVAAINGGGSSNLNAIAILWE